MIVNISFQSLCSAALLFDPTQAFRRIQWVEFSSPDSKVKHKAELFGSVTSVSEGGELRIDGRVIDQNRHATGRIMLGDVTGDKLDEVFFYQYSIGSAGAMGLSVYSLVNEQWKPIFTDPSLTTNNREEDRFTTKYAGNGQLRFTDNLTELTGIVDISELQIPGERLRMIHLQTDPISEYVVHHLNIGCVIETVQWIFAFSHPQTVFAIHNYYLYQYDKQKFMLYDTKIKDNNDIIIARK